MVTSDYPLLRLNYYASGEYNSTGGFGSKGTEIILPLSPTDLLFAQVGIPTRLDDDCSIEQTYLIKRFIAEHAFRWIVAARPVRHALWFKPRRVSLQQYNAEQKERKEYHKLQANAIYELRRSDADSADRAS